MTNEKVIKTIKNEWEKNKTNKKERKEEMEEERTGNEEKYLLFICSPIFSFFLYAFSFFV